MTTQTPPVFSDTFTRTLDDKNRITIPSEWRYGQDTEVAYLATPSSSGSHIAVLPPVEADKLVEKISAIAMGDEGGQDFAASLLGATQKLWFDKAGRIAIRPEMLQEIGITGEVVLVGAGRKFHVYHPKRWAEIEASHKAGKRGEAMRRLGI